MPTSPETSPDDLPVDAYPRILDVARRLAWTSDLGQILGTVIDGLRDTIHAERASVFQYDAEHHELFATKAHGLPDDLRIPADTGIAGEAARTREIVHIPDAYADERFNPDVDKATGFRTRDLLTVPLLDFTGDLVGVAQVLNQTTGGFTPACQAIALRLAEVAAVAIKRAALIEAERERQRIQADLDIAREIQLAALSDEIPDFSGYDIATHFEPAEETGGDALDIIDLRTIHRHCDETADAMIYLADATGHGVGPAISSVSTLAMIRMAAHLGGSLTDVLVAANSQLAKDLPGGRFVTAFLGELCLETDTLSWVSGGQAPLIFVRASGRAEEGEEALGSNAAPLGVMPELSADAAEPFRFEPGDVFVLLSDGYFETLNPDGELFGITRILDAVHRAKGGPASGIMEELNRVVNEHAQGRPADDDRTAIVIKRVGA